MKIIGKDTLLIQQVVDSDLERMVEQRTEQL